MSATLTETFPLPTAPDGWLRAWDNSADCAYCRDLQGRLLMANATFTRRFGRPIGELLNSRVADFIHPDDAGTLQTAAAALARPPFRTATEHRWRTPQGTRWFAWEETAMHDPDGAVIAIRAVGRDITRQRVAEEQFYRLSRAIEQSPVSIVITDLEGRAQYVNPKFSETAGYTLEDIIDKGIEVLREGHPDDTSFHGMWETVRSGREWRGELSAKRNNVTTWDSVKVSCLRSPAGEITNYLCLREDITDRKNLEHELRQSQKMESLGTLAGGIAHDFNNLLAIINGYSELCIESKDVQIPEAMRKGLGEIQRAVQRASGLVRQILTFSRKAAIKFSPVDLNQLARELVTLLSETLPRTVSITLNLEEPLPPLLADQNQLQQIILNLCVNARDAMPAGGAITLTTRIQPGASLGRHGAEPGRYYACLEVSDTGVGMPPEVRARIFEPFFTTKQANGGTGLGLAVVYGIVASHQGFIDVDTAPNAGTTFKIYLPLAQGATPAVTGPTTRDFPRGTESLLIVDDEASLRSLLSIALSAKGYRTTTASHGLEAIEFIGDPTQSFDAVLVDFNMPGATGLEVLRAIRTHRPNAKVLMMSGHITAEVREECRKLSHYDFLHKPYTLDKMGRELRQLFDRTG